MTEYSIKRVATFAAF